MNQTIERALISVFKKDGVVDLAQTLQDAGVTILSTGGTARLLREAGITVKDVSEVTGFPEMMDGRVKTLHPRIHGGLLMRRDLAHHNDAASENGITPIDLVVVNLYPFSDVIAQEGTTDGDAIEMIDIGGPSMVRSAAKNHQFVTVLTDPSDYDSFAASFRENGGSTTLESRRSYARKAFAHTAAYDATIARYLSDDDLLPEKLTVSFDLKQTLRYGENPHQRAAAYVQGDCSADTVADATMHSGKELSFNNYLDANAALESVKGLVDPAVSIIKHKNPCGAAVRKSGVMEAFLCAYEGDPISAFGGIVAFNRPVTAEVAKEMAVKEKFFEVIVAPSYEEGAIEIIQTGAKWGKNVRILEVGPLQPRASATGERELRWIRGGLLVQDPDLSIDSEFNTSTDRTPTDSEMLDLAFAWEMVRHVTSNAIVFVKDQQIVSVGAGQMSRIDAVDFAIRKAGEEKCRGAVMSSDAFFPFDDCVRAAHAAGLTAVAQPGGSIRDKQVVSACNELDMAMVLTGRRHFRH